MVRVRHVTDGQNVPKRLIESDNVHKEKGFNAFYNVFLQLSCTFVYLILSFFLNVELIN